MNVYQEALDRKFNPKLQFKQHDEEDDPERDDGDTIIRGEN